MEYFQRMVLLHLVLWWRSFSRLMTLLSEGVWLLLFCERWCDFILWFLSPTEINILYINVDNPDQRHFNFQIQHLYIIPTPKYLGLRAIARYIIMATPFQTLSFQIFLINYITKLISRIPTNTIPPINAVLSLTDLALLPRTSPGSWLRFRGWKGPLLKYWGKGVLCWYVIWILSHVMLYNIYNDTLLQSR